MSNLDLYNKVRKPPEEALKAIGGGRLKGMTDINPMWRLKALTEQFGMCGIGWKYVITKQWLEQGCNGEISAFVNIDIFIKVDGEWSEAIPGTGGSSFVSKESAGLRTSDECFKMALTDAISVACKSLGFGADVYWAKDKTKYDTPEIKQGKNESGDYWMGEHKVSDPLPVGKANQSDALKPLELKCKSCGDVITTKVLGFSVEKFGRPLCMKCQNETKKVGAK